jgi:hypothetical protein
MKYEIILKDVRKWFYYKVIEAANYEEAEMLGKRLADEITIEQLYKWRSKYDEDILCGIEFDSVEEYEDEDYDEDE